jgi:hypothetical protein
VDNAFADSPFAAETSFVVPTPARNTSVARDVNGVIQFKWLGTPGLTYQIETSTDLANWSNFGSATASETGALDFSDSIAAEAGQRFYRVVYP